MGKKTNRCWKKRNAKVSRQGREKETTISCVGKSSRSIRRRRNRTKKSGPLKEGRKEKTPYPKKSFSPGF